MTQSSPFRLVLPWLFLAAVFLLAPRVLTSGTWLTMMSVMGVMIIFALSYNMLLGQTGLLSFGHAVYYGLAGFVVVHAMNMIIRQKLNIPLPFVPMIGGFAGLFFGIIFGSLSTRRAGTVFSMISLGLAELVAASSLILRGFFGGEEGVTTNRTKFPAFFGYKFGPQIEVYYLIAFWCFVSVLAMYCITRTPFGRMCNAVRENPERAEFVGYSTQRIRFIAFCLSAFFAGIAGALAAINFEIMNAQSVGAIQSGNVLLMTFVGGTGHFFGPILGAIIVTVLQISLSDITGAWMLYFGLMFIFVVMYSPGGLAGWLMLHQPLLKAGRLGRLLPSYGLMLIPALCLMAGVIFTIEVAHHGLVKAGDGPMAHVLKLSIDTTKFYGWLIGPALIAVGVLLGRRWWPRVTAAWSDAQLSAGGKRA